MGYRVFVRDKPQTDGTMPLLGEVDTWMQLNLTIRFNAAGSWQMLIKVGTPQERLLQNGRGIVVYQDNIKDPIFSGPINSYEKYWTVDQHTGPGSVFVGGPCDNQIPFGFLAFPGTTGTGKDVMTVSPITEQWKGSSIRPAYNSVGQAMWVEMDMAFGARALADRKLKGVVVGANPATGPDINDSLRYDNLGTKFQSWLENKQYGFRFLWSPKSRKIELTLYTCKDLGKTIRFSPELGNIREYTWQLHGPSVTRAVVACQGEGSERYIFQKVDTEAEALWHTITEVFVDRRDIPLTTDAQGKPVIVVKKQADGTEEIGQGPDGKPWPGGDAANPKTVTQAQKDAARDYYLKVVQDAATAALKEGEKTGHFQVYPINTPQCQFGRDYYVGDVVTVQADDQTITDAVHEVTIAVDDGGTTDTVTPKIGDQGTGQPLNLYKQVSEMREKLRKLEARM
ncbi:siphovirus ReqiPepy6 Gp37-like family protein [Streptomyces sp. BI20]|uniref:siphovirus ReqiPepy6 Gp37-like family protein n=1 Tax=Streptomyces sp. BI20 TaxID=3403460 RepID=UPI003C7734D7